MSTIEEGREQYRQQASILREYAGELQQVRGSEPPDVFDIPESERAAFLTSPLTGYRTIIEALAWHADRATAVSYETHARFTHLSEQNMATNSRLPEELDSHREGLQQQYEKVAGIANTLKECLGNAAIIAGHLRNIGWKTVDASGKSEVELHQRAQIAEQDADRL